MSRSLARDWWKKAEKLAGLKPKWGRGRHSLRRKFASDLMDGPATCVGGLLRYVPHGAVEDLVRSRLVALPWSLETGQHRAFHAHGDLVGAIRLYDFRPVLEFPVQLRYVAEIDALVLHGRGLLGREGHFAARIDPQELTCKYKLAHHASYGHLSRDR